MITDDINILTQVLNNQAKIEEDRKKKRTLMLLGAKFSQEINKASDTESLVSTMMKANKLSFEAGVPELAQQVSNLASIKGMEIKYNKDQMDQNKLADFYTQNYSSLSVMEDGNIMTLGETKSFKSLEGIPSNLKPDAIKLLYQKLAYKSEDAAIEMKGGFGYVRYGTNSSGQTKLIEQLNPNSDGTYDNALSTDIQEHLPETPQITIAKSKALEEERKLRRNADIYYGKMQANQDKPTLMVLDDGTPALISFKQDQKTGRTYAVNLMGDDPKADVSKKLSGKMSTAKNENPFSSLKSFETTKNEYEKDLVTASGTVRSLLASGVLDDVPDEGLSDAIGRYNKEGKNNSIGFLQAQYSNIQKYINENYKTYSGKNDQQSREKLAQIVKLQDALSAYDAQQKQIKNFEMKRPFIQETPADTTKPLAGFIF